MLLLSSLYAEEETRPRVGLVLSGGGARGLAHIGVIKVIEEAGIDVDCVTGTSMGSIIGSLHAIGYSGIEIEALVREIDWDVIMYDRLPRRQISMEEKRDLARYIGSFPIDLDKFSISLPSGLVAGQNFQTMMARVTLSVHHIDNFRHFPRPFLCLATDVETGEPVVLDHGNITECVRASMSIPSLFTPVELDGRLLVDGGIMRNFPVQEVRDLGADIVIGCDVSLALYKREELSSLVRIMHQCISFQGIRSILEGYEQTDILIQPEVAEYSITDFTRIDSLIALGERAAREKFPELLALADILNRNDDDSPRPLLFIDSLYIVRIRTEGLDNVSKDLVIGKLRLNEHSWIRTDELDRAVNRLYGTQYFERVSYTLEPVQGGVVLVLHLVEKTTQDFRFGLRYNNDLKAAVLLNLTFRNLLIEGSKLSIDWKLSEFSGLTVSSFIHTGWKPGFGIGLDLFTEDFEVRSYNESVLESTWDYRNTGISLRLQTLFHTQWSLGLGGEISDARGESIIIPDDFPYDDFKMRYMHWFWFLHVDTLDRAVFPRKGVKLELSGRCLFAYYTLDKQDFDPVVDQYILRYTEIVQLLDNFSMALHMYGGVSQCNDPFPSDQAFYVGGNETNLELQFPFDGLHWMELVSRNAAVVIVEGQVEVIKNVFLIGRLDAGKVAQDLKTLTEMRHFITGAGFGVGLMTPIGPMHLSQGFCNRREGSLTSVRIGYQF
ncbi:MAG: patatin-like phospholipase family protein [Candidatus Cloacimonetes bacterium]|nr:patatin-like phospholipase family protein [Candidatus Cloacimonadota bacterium]